MSLNTVSRIALAFGALTIATLPAFAETATTTPAPAAAVAAPATPAAPVATAAPTATAKPAVTHHVKKATSHHKKVAKKAVVEKTGMETAKPAAGATTAPTATP